jgi:hypothetical protein
MDIDENHILSRKPDSGRTENTGTVEKVGLETVPLNLDFKRWLNGSA